MQGERLTGSFLSEFHQFKRKAKLLSRTVYDKILMQKNLH
ncbi:hypothetical protein CKA32_004193 [Geitlerinema sp. FC II]|nr:hypothetical protein CKA32_004193 [Geitlerinema sp. FC II]